MSDVVAAPPADPWVSFMQRAMSDPNFDTTKFAALLEMRHREMEQQRIERSEERKRIFSDALSAFQGEVEPVLRDAVNPFLKNRYATLLKTVETAQPYMRNHGLYVRYVSADAPAGWVKMGIVLAHLCGHEDEPFWMSVQTTDTGSKGGKLPMTPSQAVAATMTYLRRQLYTTALNLVAGEIDDDGEALRQAPQAPQMPQRPEAAWQNWVGKLRTRLWEAAPMGTDAVAEVTERDTIKQALAQAPQWVKNDAMALMAEAMEEAAKLEAERKLNADPFTDPIEGEDKAAG